VELTVECSAYSWSIDKGVGGFQFVAVHVHRTFQWERSPFEAGESSIFYKEHMEIGPRGVDG
jgi:hypothetical protein